MNNVFLQSLRRRAFIILGVALVLTGCVSVGEKQRNSNKSAIKKPALKESSLAQAHEAPLSKISGTLPGDGACANIPTKQVLDNIPEATPFFETLMSGPSRPYVVMIKGKTKRYTPMKSNRPFRQVGFASWYGCKYHGKLTASGEPYDVYKMTAAHPILPIPSYVRVTNLSNQRSLVLRVNDRGPFIGNRIIDVSYVAAYRLGLLKHGTAKVLVERILSNASDAKNKPKPTVANVSLKAPKSISQVKTEQATPRLKAPTPKPAPAAVTNASVAKLAPVGAKNTTKLFYLQLGAFSSGESARLERAAYAQRNLGANVDIIKKSGLFKIILGPFKNSVEAQQMKQSLKARNISAFVIRH